MMDKSRQLNKNSVQLNNNFEKISDFTIDHILNRAGEQFNNELNTNNCDEINLNEFELHLKQCSELNYNGIPPILNWLQYTRYKPPKIQRPFRNGPIKRTPGRLPRVPFTPAQLKALEDSYKISNYSSSETANKLAIDLNLTNTRIRIWFQNRRARERRERRERGESPDLITPMHSS